MSKEIKKYDERGNLIYMKVPTEEELWYKYDERGNEVYRKYSNGCEMRFEYDDRNNEIHFKKSNGDKCLYECWREFDKNNNMIYFKNGDGWESFNKYENNRYITISEKEFEWIKFKEKEKEFLSRTPVSRFSLMDII